MSDCCCEVSLTKTVETCEINKKQVENDPNYPILLESSWPLTILDFLNFQIYFNNFPDGHKLIVQRSVLQLLHDRLFEVLDVTLLGVPGQTRRGEVVVVAGEV